MIMFISNTGESLPIAHRIKNEGTPVEIYVHQPDYKNNYNGIMNKTSLAQLKKRIEKADVIIFDMNHINEKKKADIRLLKIFGIKTNSYSVFGPIGDKLKRDHKVVGCSGFTEIIELDRVKGIRLAERIGLNVPQWRSFKTLREGIGFLTDKKNMWVFKPLNNKDIDLTYVEKFPGELITKMKGEYKNRIPNKINYILQEKITGIEISTEVWIAEKGPVHFNHTLENKRFMNSDLGPAIGSQSNTVWLKKNQTGLLVKELNILAQLLINQKYTGPCDVNCIINEADKQPYFLEWTPRFGYDALFALVKLLKTSYTDFFTKDFSGQWRDGFAAAERISIPPYPYCTPRLLLDFAKDVSVMEDVSRNKNFFAQDIYNNGELKCAGADGILGVIAASGDSIGGAWGNVYRAIDKLKICSYIQNRTDGAKRHEIRYNKLRNWNIAVN